MSEGLTARASEPSNLARRIARWMGSSTELCKFFHS